MQQYKNFNSIQREELKRKVEYESFSCPIPTPLNWRKRYATQVLDVLNIIIMTLIMMPYN